MYFIFIGFLSHRRPIPWTLFEVSNLWARVFLLTSLLLDLTFTHTSSRVRYSYYTISPVNILGKHHQNKSNQLDLKYLVLNVIYRLRLFLNILQRFLIDPPTIMGKSLPLGISLLYLQILFLLISLLGSRYWSNLSIAIDLVFVRALKEHLSSIPFWGAVLADRIL